jgi:DNA polymerase/3'-5' exonuclease PolX
MTNFNKDTIIQNLVIIRNYEVFKKQPLKMKAYNTVIANLLNYTNDINDLKDLKNIKGIGLGITTMLSELQKTGKISYIEKIIKQDIEYMKTIKITRKTKFNKNVIIKKLTIIIDYLNYINNIQKSTIYTKSLHNIMNYSNDINDINDIITIKDINTEIFSIILELYKTGKISYIEDIIKKDSNYVKPKPNIKTKTKPNDKTNDKTKPNNDNKKEKPIFNVKTIIENLAIIRDYELAKNEIFKYKAYKKVIDNLYSIININDTITINDLKEIKGIGKGILTMLEELEYTGKITYIENVIKTDNEYTIPVKLTTFNKNTIIEQLMIIRDYEIYMDEKFKVKAYNNAIDNIILYSNDLKDLKDLKEITGIGKGISDKIKELYETGKISYIENNINNDKTYKFKQELLSIYGIGPINAKKIIAKGIISIEQLRQHQELLNAKQKIGLKYYNELKERIPLPEFKKHITILKKDLVKNKLIFDFVGSYRRGNQSMGDIDLLIMSNPKFILKDYITKLIDSGYIIEILASGNNKFMGIVKINNHTVRRLDILVAPIEEYYFSLLYFTGSSIFNIGMRHYVKTKFNLSLSEHGFEHKKIDNITSEEDIFKFLKIKYIQPKDRNIFNV